MVRISVVVMKHRDRKQLWERRFMISELAPTIQGSQGHGVPSSEAERDECWVALSSRSPFYPAVDPHGGDNHRAVFPP